jgi:hypothetical protein
MLRSSSVHIGACAHDLRDISGFLLEPVQFGISIHQVSQLLGVLATHFGTAVFLQVSPGTVPARFTAFNCLKEMMKPALVQYQLYHLVIHYGTRESRYRYKVPGAGDFVLGMNIGIISRSQHHLLQREADMVVLVPNKTRRRGMV